MTYRVEVRVRNGLLWKAIHARYKNVAQFCREHSLSQAQIGALLNLTISPLTAAMEWRKFAMDAADALGMLPDELWPDHMRARLDRSFAALEMSAEDVQALVDMSDPHEVLACKELRARIDEALEELLPNEQFILRLRFGLNAFEEEHTLESIATEMGVTPERVRQVEKRALRKLRALGRNRLSPLRDAADHVSGLPVHIDALRRPDTHEAQG